ncbi:MAG TPA: VWA domain-containing protein [Thermoanaerobaculia bacterium]|nr:VWA domain-containing protein [Thermoanaerobaculia bacterium]
MTEPLRIPLFEKAVLFARTLRQAGIPVAPSQAADFARALRWIDLSHRSHVLYAARATLVTRREDLGLFERLFDRFWGVAPSRAAVPQKAPPAHRTAGGERRRPALASFLARRSSARDAEVEEIDRSGTASDLEVLMHKDFAQMEQSELEAVRRLIGSLELSAAERVTRRRVPVTHGDRLDPRRLLRLAARHGGLVAKPPRARRKVKPRPLVVVADISGSMERYSRMALLFLHALTRRLTETETFVFGTRLTRITEGIRLRDVEHALDVVAEEVYDWAGGTRIGPSLASFNRRWASRLLRRGAVVLILSDGCERGETSTLRRELRAIRDHCHRLIWLNPRLGHPEYEPLAAGVAEAIPLVDDFLPIHNVQSLGQLAEHLSSIPRRRSARRSSPR